MTNDQIAELERLAREVRPGPWDYNGDHAHFTNARASIARLLEERRRLRDALREMVCVEDPDFNAARAALAYVESEAE